jgi:hypothetical protein
LALNTDFLIDEEFRSLIPPIAADERVQLEANLVADGCRDPLVLGRVSSPEFNGGSDALLIDGHNRFEICSRLGVAFDTVELVFETKDDAKLWIVRNQLGRRNISDFVRAELALVAKPIVEAKARANLVASGERYGKGSENSHNPIAPVHTDTTIADMAGVSSNTVRKVERIKESAGPELLAAVRSGDVSINAASAVASLPVSHQVDIVARGEKEIVKAATEILAKKAAERIAHRAERAVEREEKAEPQLQIDIQKVPVVIPETPKATAEFSASTLYRSIEMLASIEYSATELSAALPLYQHYRVHNHIDAALALLNQVKESWENQRESVQ